MVNNCLAVLPENPTLRRWLIALLVALVAAMLLAPTAAFAAPNDQSTTQAATQAPQAHVQQGSAPLLDPKAFNVFGSSDMNSGIGKALAKLLLRMLIIGFDICLVIGVALLFWKLGLLIAGRATKEDAMNHLVNMGIGIVGIVTILTGVLAILINYLILGGRELQKDLPLGFLTPPAAVAYVDPANPDRTGG